MPINLTIEAEVIDIRSAIPQQDDIFLVDTNVWLWQTYTNAIASSRNYQQRIGNTAGHYTRKANHYAMKGADKG